MKIKWLFLKFKLLSYKDEVAFPEFEDVPNSQVILYSYSSSFLDTTKKKKEKKKKEK